MMELQHKNSCNYNYKVALFSVSQLGLTPADCSSIFIVHAVMLSPLAHPTQSQTAF